jgi:hypothetical protein
VKVICKQNQSLNIAKRTTPIKPLSDLTKDN